MNHLTIHKHQKSSYLYAHEALHLSRTLYKSALFMQNKPNFLNTQINVSSFLAKHYEDHRFRTRCQNKPNQPQSQPPHRPGRFLYRMLFDEQPPDRRYLRKSRSSIGLHPFAARAKFFPCKDSLRLAKCP